MKDSVHMFSFMKKECLGNIQGRGENYFSDFSFLIVTTKIWSSEIIRNMLHSQYFFQRPNMKV